MPENSKYDDNPEWTEKDVKIAKRLDDVPDLARRVRGPQKAPKKVKVTIRLSPEVVEHFKAQGKGWQSRLDETLKKALGG